MRRVCCALLLVLGLTGCQIDMSNRVVVSEMLHESYGLTQTDLLIPVEDCDGSLRKLHDVMDILFSSMSFFTCERKTTGGLAAYQVEFDIDSRKGLVLYDRYQPTLVYNDLFELYLILPESFRRQLDEQASIIKQARVRYEITIENDTDHPVLMQVIRGKITAGARLDNYRLDAGQSVTVTLNEQDMHRLLQIGSLQILEGPYALIQ